MKQRAAQNDPKPKRIPIEEPFRAPVENPPLRDPVPTSPPLEEPQVRDPGERSPTIEEPFSTPVEQPASIRSEPSGSSAE